MYRIKYSSGKALDVDYGYIDKNRKALKEGLVNGSLSIECSCCPNAPIPMTLTNALHLETVHRIKDRDRHAPECRHRSNAAKVTPSPMVKRVEGYIDISFKIGSKLCKVPGVDKCTRHDSPHGRKSPGTMDSVARLLEIISMEYVSYIQREGYPPSTDRPATFLYSYAMSHTRINGMPIDKAGMGKLFIVEVTGRALREGRRSIDTSLGIFMIDYGVLEAAEKLFSNSYNGLTIERALSTDGCHVMAIFFKDDDRGRIQRLGFMLCCDCGLFCESLYEVRFFNMMFGLLGTLGMRTLILEKPYTPTGDYSNPMFISDARLLIRQDDGYVPVCIFEVFGRLDTEYRETVEIKKASCTHEFITWDPAMGEELEDVRGKILNTIGILS